MNNRKNKSELPFNSTSSNEFNKFHNNKNTENTITYECNNIDFFTDIDPDLNYINHTNKTCSYYTINEFNKDYFNYNQRKNYLSLFHTNIRSSSQNLKCYLSTLNIDFSIIGLSKTWGKQDTIDLRNLPGYIHHHYIRSDKRGGGVSLSIKKVYNINYEKL